MRKLLLLLGVAAAPLTQAQTPCETGRYAEDVFTNVTVTSDIEYGSNTSFSGGTTTLRLDFYEPEGDTETERPLLIWVHGGSFIGGSRTDQDMVTLSERFAKKGYACASISYRLGFFPFDSTNAVRAVVRAVQDLRGAVRFFRKDAATINTYKIDPTKIYVGGSSAGAITALHVAYLNDECEIEDYLNASQISSLGGLEGESGNPGYTSEVAGVINLCGAIARYSWIEADEVPVVSLHGTTDGTVQYNRGIVDPGTPLMYLDGSRMVHERACAIGLENKFYTFPGAGHVPYLNGAGAQAYMDTTVNVVRDFLISQLGCDQAELQPENAWLESATLYPLTYCDGSPVNEVCPLTVGLGENTLSQWVMYPNPATNEVTIVLDNSSNYSVTVLDLMGRTVYQASFNSAQTTIDTQTLNAGNYFVRIIDNNTNASETSKLIVQ